ncbi:MAG: hypothetical protein FWG85_08185 [Bacteroidetes bacterium]|nr:hypothetical protein [Bacteroidota bacterium]
MGNKTLQIVSYEQAQKLKKLGFDWECYLAYRIADNEFGKKSNEPVSYQGAVLEDYAHAPSVALALKWFRNVKRVNGSVFQAVSMHWHGLLSKYGANPDEDVRIYSEPHIWYEHAETDLLDRLILFAEEVSDGR